MIPEFVDIKSVWNVLPQGIHDATLDEIEKRFATNDTRKRLYQGFKKGVEALQKAGCKVVYLDGSFVSQKENPGDFDACWDPSGVDDTELDPVLLEFTHGRISQKLKYGGEFFLSSARADGSRTFLQYFQVDKDTGDSNGIIRIQI